MAEFLAQLAIPDSVVSSECGSDKLGLGSGFRDNGLELASPTDCARTHLRQIASGGLPAVGITSDVICIDPGLEDRSGRVRSEREFEILGVLKVTEEVLDGVPVSRTGIVVESGEAADGLLDIRTSGDGEVVEGTDCVEVRNVAHGLDFVRSGWSHGLGECGADGHGCLDRQTVRHVEASKDVEDILALGKVDGALLLVVSVRQVRFQTCEPDREPMNRTCRTGLQVRFDQVRNRFGSRFGDC